MSLDSDAWKTSIFYYRAFIVVIILLKLDSRVIDFVISLKTSNSCFGFRQQIHASGKAAHVGGGAGGAASGHSAPSNAECCTCIHLQRAIAQVNVCRAIVNELNVEHNVH